MTVPNGRPTRSTPLLAIGGLLAALAGPAPAAMQPKARLDEIAALAEHNNAQARTILVQEGQKLIAGAPYPVRIHYLRLLRRTQADAGNFREAFETNELIIGLAEAERDPLNLALASLARVLRLIENNDPAKALGQLATLGARYRKLDSPEFTATAEALHGMAYSAVGQYDRALHHFLRALDMVKRHPGLWSPREADIRLAMARMYVNSRDPARALETLREIRTGATRLAPRTAAAAHFFEGRALVAQDELEGAQQAFGRALELAHTHQLIAIEANVLGNIANAYLKAGRYQEAEEAARAALAPAERSEDKISLQMAKANLGFALFGQGRQSEGMQHVDAVIAAMRKAGAMSAVGRLLAEKSLALESAGRFREALATTREREAVTQDLAVDERNKAISALQEQFKARERAAQIDALRQENAVKDTELRHRSLIQTAASLGASVALFMCAGVLWMYRKSVLTGRRLAELNDELAYRSAHDPLTGLFNRRSFLDRMRSRTGQAPPRLGSADCFTLLDIDHFKRINDEYGHAAGDAVLVEVGKRLRAAMRESDMVLRWGGEEFLVYSQGVTQEQRPLLVGRILDAIAATPIVLDDGTALRISATAGAVSLPFAPDGDETRPEATLQPDWEQAIALADRALYKGKEAGRNRGYIVAGLRRPEGGLELDLVLPGVAG
ncbi:GGDEF domain-containing protein [Massilia sp. CFBP9012]|uniref:GGDEF domain-containing protein n=1 Tax=Massilia sp. CFBP9012 TaxID=3096531 RepID=UPI002A6A7F91|nr:GGDEF domain-containing protein [Massilia sp. CFBP9012]MDY0975769.1 GGDEF domain-containing protein [Massilia sp. CFBP9012]